MQNLVGAKSPPGSEQGSVTLRMGLHKVKCLNVCGTFIGKSISFFFGLIVFERVSQKRIWLWEKNELVR